MDSVELLRSHYDDQRGPDAARLDAMHQRLRERIEAEGGQRRPHPAFTRRLVLSAGAGVAVLASAAVLVTGLPGEQPAAATELLQRAARHAAGSPSAAPGSVSQIRKRFFEVVGGGDGLGTPQVVATRETVDQLKIPVGSEPWEQKRWETVYEFAYGDRSKLPEDMAVVDPTGRTGALYERSRSGDFAVGTTDPDGSTIAESLDSIRDLPRDPDALLRALEADGGGPGRGSAQQVLRSAADVLERGVAGRELQAAVFQALQRVPDLAVLDQRATDIEGRTGVGLGVKAGVPDPTDSGYSLRLIIDPATGQYLGSQGVSTRRDGLVPAGVQIWADAVRTGLTPTRAEWTPPEGQRWAVTP